jgi:hypothetical protein
MYTGWLGKFRQRFMMNLRLAGDVLCNVKAVNGALPRAQLRQQAARKSP